VIVFVEDGERHAVVLVLPGEHVFLLFLFLLLFLSASVS
jgi:hypothetical protein